MVTIHTYREFDNSYDIIGDIGRYSDDQLGIQYEFATQMRLPDVSTGAGEVKLLPAPKAPKTGKLPGKTIDPATGEEVGRFIVDPKGNTMIEPVGGSTVPAGKGGIDTHTLYSNGSNY